ncbi:hypothetical protein, partial [Serratia marcescens]|uniref:hypothetical protein n=1 Tax=Serratia marcescens TaxID=615 RepID=UPI0019538D00
AGIGPAASVGGEPPALKLVESAKAVPATVCTCRETAAEKDTGNFVVFDTIARTVRKSCGRELTKVTFRDRHS